MLLPRVCGCVVIVDFDCSEIMKCVNMIIRLKFFYLNSIICIWKHLAYIWLSCFSPSLIFFFFFVLSMMLTLLNKQKYLLSPEINLPYWQAPCCYQLLFFCLGIIGNLQKKAFLPSLTLTPIFVKPFSWNFTFLKKKIKEKGVAQFWCQQSW